MEFIGYNRVSLFRAQLDFNTRATMIRLSEVESNWVFTQVVVGGRWSVASGQWSHEFVAKRFGYRF